MTASLTLGVTVSGPDVVSVRLTLTVDPGDVVSDDPFVVGVRPVGTSGAWQTFTVYGATAVPFDVSLPTGTLSPPGAYAFQATQPSVGVSNTVYAAVSAEGDDCYNAFIDAIQVVIAQLALPEIGDKVYDRIIETTDVTFPCIQLTLAGLPNIPMAENYVGSSSGTDDFGLPVRITIADRQEPNYPGQRRRYLNWRGRIRDALINLRPAYAPRTWKTEIVPQFVVLPSRAENLYLTSIMVARGVTRIVRRP